MPRVQVLLPLPERCLISLKSGVSFYIIKNYFNEMFSKISCKYYIICTAFLCDIIIVNVKNSLTFTIKDAFGCERNLAASRHAAAAKVNELNSFTIISLLKKLKNRDLKLLPQKKKQEDNMARKGENIYRRKDGRWEARGGII